MKDFDFQSNWSRMSTPPHQSGKRYIVTDGDVVIIATYISESSGNVWIFNGLNEHDANSFVVQGWMELPTPIKKIVSFNDSTQKENISEINENNDMNTAVEEPKEFF